MAIVPDNVRPLFIAAGWHPARRVRVSTSISIDHPAHTILSAFGGLHVKPDREAGEECGPDDLHFQECARDESYEDVWDALLGTRLIGVALVHQGHGQMYVADDGRCFGSSFVHEAFWFAGQTFGDAVERCLLGRRSQPMLAPNQASVRLYGIEYTRDSLELYRHH